MTSKTVLQTLDIYGASSHRNQNRDRFRKFSISLSMKDVSASSQTGKNMEGTSQEISIVKPSNLCFDSTLPSDHDFDCMHKRAFGSFIIREVLLDEEYWTAAWLRAETNWEDRSDERYAESYKRKFTDQEYYALKRRCRSNLREKCTCLVAVKQDEQNVKRTALNSIFGTLDVSIRHLLPGEMFPGDRSKANMSAGPGTNIAGPHRYGYVSNLCIRKSARRQGIASNMMRLAVQVAKSAGVEEVFVHVERKNMAAQQLYSKIGFQMVEMDMAHSSEDQNYLMSCRTT
ncbi:GCN5-related N-acetyltransferase 6, chloroplastic isoform X1 [Magnolia sinica]|uniref:GCN5-related N-acetyltransferase 6, chloroplastic isoform X1 n=1 Tax=Magnolia sinica TaxID=86752 RepID=UPI00265B4FD5|nr:GCN5-related N-acetyltransferase 6, chloroplastic isoform X1 [Magnolia sinica]